jgi:hypothetical protein
VDTPWSDTLQPVCSRRVQVGETLETLEDPSEVIEAWAIPLYHSRHTSTDSVSSSSFLAAQFIVNIVRIVSNLFAAISLLQSLCRNLFAAISLPQSLCRNLFAAISLPQSLCRNLFAAIFAATFLGAALCAVACARGPPRNLSV